MMENYGECRRTTLPGFLFEVAFALENEHSFFSESIQELGVLRYTAVNTALPPHSLTWGTACSGTCIDAGSHFYWPLGMSFSEGCTCNRYLTTLVVLGPSYPGPHARVSCACKSSPKTKSCNSATVCCLECHSSKICDLSCS